MLWNAIMQSIKKRDEKPYVKLAQMSVKNTIISYCNQYLNSLDDELTIEALPTAINEAISVLESEEFQETYEFTQDSPSIFIIRLKEFDLL